MASRLFRVFVLTLMALGLIARIAPLFDSDGRLFQQFPTEDGYLMLTIARNLAIGKGFSIADGTIPTNGTQPLATLIYSLCFVITGGARWSALLLIQLLQLLNACVAALFLFKLGQKIFRDSPDVDRIAALSAAVWFASAVTLPHSMNCLETGFYGLIVLLVAHVFIEDQNEGLWPVKKCLWVGLLLGVGFWIRNDACFLILAACLVHLFLGAPKNGSSFWTQLSSPAIKARFGRALIFGSVSVLTASPWLIYNLTNFGHIMPVSGRAESLTGSFASNFTQLPQVLTEYLSAIVLIPNSIQLTQPGFGVGLLGLLGLVWLLKRIWGHGAHHQQGLIMLGSIYLVCMCGFYGLFFGAGWFLSRYFFPLSPLFVLLWAFVLIHLQRKLKGPAVTIVPAMTSAAILLITAGLNLRGYQKGPQHQHFQVVRWVQKNVAQEDWVGAVQTGTVGFFHDRTINLDGKVNPAAYHALIAKRAPEYVVQDTQIKYMADWAGVTNWMRRPIIAKNFVIVVEDHALNLGVLKRKDR